MKNIFFYALLSLIILYQPAFADNSLNAVVASQFTDITNNTVLFEENPNTLLIPASNQKILSLFSALHLLNTNESLETIVASNDKINNNQVDNLYIKFSADPDLTTAQLNEMIKQVKQLGLNKVKQTVYIDDHEFDNEHFGLGWLIDQTKFCFSAPVSPIIIDHNCFTATVTVVDGKIHVVNNNPLIKIKNEAVLTDKMDNCDLELQPYFNNNYLLHGCATIDLFPLKLSIALQDPKRYAKLAISHLLQTNHISFDKVEFGKTPDKTIHLASHLSKPIHDLLVDMMRDSDNLIADLLFKKTAYAYTEKSGTWKNGATILESLLARELNTPKETFVVFDGSGMSRKNLISPNIFNKLLINAYSDSKISSQFVSYFPNYDFKLIPANNLNLVDKVIAKTGTLENISALTGYIYLKDQRIIAFSVIVNNASNSIKDIRTFLENYIAQVIVDYC